MRNSVVEDINLYFNKEMYSYVIDIKYRQTDENGNIDIYRITDLPISLSRYPEVTCNIDLMGCKEAYIDLGFGRLKTDPIYTKLKEERVHTATNEMTIEEIEKALGHPVKIVKEKKND